MYHLFCFGMPQGMGMPLLGSSSTLCKKVLFSLGHIHYSHYITHMLFIYCLDTQKLVDGQKTIKKIGETRTLNKINSQSKTAKS